MVPLFDFQCEECGKPFEELAPLGSRPARPACGSVATRRLFSPIAGAQKWHLDRRFAAESNARRSRARGAAERFAEDRKRCGAERP